jgi:uncharacterized DUF497 family protein
MIEIVWDDPKRQANLAKHGLDFASVPFELFLTARIATAKAGRYQALGLLAGRPVVVIFKRLGSEAFSLISLRPAGAAERKEL